MMREKVTQIQETQRVPIKRNTKRTTSRNLKWQNSKTKRGSILKAAKEKQEVTYKGAPKVSN